VARVTVLVRPDSSLSLQQQAPANDAARDVVRIADELGVSLKPVHPGVADLDLN
jgi:hypothetical protein